MSDVLWVETPTLKTKNGTVENDVLFGSEMCYFKKKMNKIFWQRKDKSSNQVIRENSAFTIFYFG
jgi:hypothetical protein